jgi:hypothetical protein
MWTGKIRKFATRRLSGYAKQKNLKRITGSFRGADQAMRMKAIDGLYEVACAWKKQDLASYRRACSAFVLALKDPDADVRFRCVERLKALASDAEFPEPGLLLLALRDPSAQVRELGARACLESNNLPLMMEALKNPDTEVRRIVASGIGDDIYVRLQRIDAFNRWNRGLHSARGKAAPSGDSAEDRALYLRDKAMDEQMLRYISKAVVTFLKASGLAGLAEEVFVKALRIYNPANPRYAALSHLTFALVNNDSTAADAGLRLLQGDDPGTLLQPYMERESAPAAAVSPRCDSCSKELEALDLSEIPESLKSPSLALYEGVVCTVCRKVQCSACKESRREDSCKWCGRRTTLALSHFL